jgi:outer membrane receptor protein involved in Fe transport
MGSAVAAVVFVAAVLQAPAPLTGTIRAADGTPIAAATITVRQDDRILTATSDKAGQYTFADVTLPVVVEVRAPGFGEQSRLVDASPADFTLAPASVRESVVVSSSGFAVASIWRQADTGQTTLIRDDLLLVPAITPDESLKVISGFSLFRRSTARASNPTTHGVTMRGLSASGASRGLVLLDGIPLNEAFGSWVTWTRVPPAAIAEVDVDRGAQSDVFGSDALGGAIDLKSRTGVKPGLASVAGEGGSHGLGSADLAAGLRRGRWAAFGAMGWLTNDGEIPVEPASRGAVDRPASADWTNALGRLDGTWDRAKLTVAGWGGGEERGNGTVQQWNRMRGCPPAPTTSISPSPRWRPAATPRRSRRFKASTRRAPARSSRSARACRSDWGSSSAVSGSIAPPRTSRWRRRQRRQRAR